MPLRCLQFQRIREIVSFLSFNHQMCWRKELKLGENYLLKMKAWKVLLNLFENWTLKRIANVVLMFVFDDQYKAEKNFTGIRGFHDKEIWQTCQIW